MHLDLARLAVAARLATFAALTTHAVAGHAWVCEGLKDAVDESRLRLDRATRSPNPDDGKYATARAAAPLKEAATLALACRCDTAAASFGDASDKAQSARVATSADGVADGLRQAIRGYSDGMRAANACLREQRLDPGTPATQR